MLIYKLTNKVNNKCYVGQTTRSLAARLWAHKRAETYIGNAIRKYGIDSFKIEILDDSFKTLESLNYFEEYYVYSENALWPNGYNLMPGGRNHKWTDKSKKAFSAKRTGKGNPRWGKTFTASEETKKKLSKACIGLRRSVKTEFPSSPVICVSSGNVYPTISKAAKDLGLSHSKISLVCSGKRKTTGGLIFKYVRDLKCQ